MSVNFSIENKNNDYNSSVETKTDSTIIGNTLRGNGSELPTEDKNILRDNRIRVVILNDYNITLKEFYYILNKVYNMKPEDLYKLSDEEFQQKIELIVDGLEFTVDPSKNITDANRIDIVCSHIKETLDSGVTAKQASNTIQEFGGKSILDIIKQYGGSEFKSYKSIEEIPVEKLSALLQKMLDKHLNNNKKCDDKDLGNSEQILSNLLIQTTKNERAKLVEASIDCLKNSEVGKYILAQCKKCKSKEEFIQLIHNKGISNIISNFSIDSNTIDEIIGSLYTNSKQHGLDSAEVRDVICNAVESKVNRFTELNKKKKEGTLTPEEQKEYDEAISKTLNGFKALDERFADIYVAMLKNGDKEGANVVKEVVEDSHSIEDLHYIIAEIARKHPEKNLVELMDQVTDGQFSQKYKLEVSSTSTKSSSSENNSVGLEQKTTQETYWSAVVAVDEKIQQLYQEQQEKDSNTYIVEKNEEKTDNLIVAPFKKYASVETLSGNELVEGIAKKFIKIGDVLRKYNELTQSGQDFINKLVESMSTGIQNYFLNGLKDNIVVKIASKAHIDLSKLNLKYLAYDARKQMEKLSETKQVA